MSTSKLQEYLSWKLIHDLPPTITKYNYRPDWLRSQNGTRLELDIYLPETKIAIEVQGEQHYMFIPFFHKTHEAYEEQRVRDQEKINLCYGRGITLLIVDSEFDADLAIKTVALRLENSIIDMEDLFNDAQKKQLRKYEILKDGGVNTAAERAERLARCKKKLSQYQAGKLDATPSKVQTWINTIDNGGIEAGAYLNFTKDGDKADRESSRKERKQKERRARRELTKQR